MHRHATIGGGAVAIGAFTEKARPPEAADVARTLGGAAGLWQDAIDLMEERLGARPELHFYGRNYGWALRYRRHGRALASLYPGAGRFTAQLVLPRRVETAVRGGLRPATLTSLDAATPYPEGRWLYLPVTCRDDLAELEVLVRAKLDAT